MKRGIKLFLAWTMLALMCYNIAGYLFVFTLTENLNRAFMQKRIADADDGQLVLLKFSSATNQTHSSFIRKDKDEIIVDGKLYDVKKEVSEKGTTYFYCINDTKEEQLNKQLANEVQSNTGTATHHGNNTKFTGKNILTEFTFSKNNLIFCLRVAEATFSFITLHSLQGVGEIISPPPQV